MTDNSHRIAMALESIALAIHEQADATNNVAKALHKLGMADAATPMGAIESLGAVFKEDIARALDNIAGAITAADQ
jgi:hypothetical protein